MDLNHIQLPAAAIVDLYSSSLIESGEINRENNPTAITTDANEKVISNTSEETGSWKWLGENKKNILVAVRHKEAVHLPDSELQFLTGILSACQLSLADVAIVNLEKHPGANYKPVTEQFQSRIALLFDVEPASFGLPMSFPHFQIQPFANCSFIYAPSLSELENDKVLKSKLWVILRRMFNI
jgi:hypothetical protein